MKPSSGTSKNIFGGLTNLGISSGFHALYDVIREGHFGAAGIIGSSLFFVISEVFAHFTGEQTAHIRSEVFERLGKTPLELNHNLQELFIEAGYEAITEGIPIWYNRESKSVNRPELDEDLKAKLFDLAKHFRDSFYINDSEIKKNDNRSFKNRIISSDLIRFLKEDEPGECLEIFDVRRGIDSDHYPEKFLGDKKFPHEYLLFFKEHFCQAIRILFIEGLKSKEFEKARIAYEQMMAEETYKSLNDIKDEITQLKNSGKYSESKYAMISEQEITISIEKLNSSSDIQVLLRKGLDNYFESITTLLYELNQTAEDTKVRIAHIDLKADRIEKGVKWNITLAIIIVAFSAAAAVFAYYYFSGNRTDLKLSIEDSKHKKIKSGFMYLDVKKNEHNEAMHVLGKLNDEGILVFENIKRSHLENDIAELSLYGELEDKYEIPDSSKMIILKNADLKKIILAENTSKKNKKPKSETVIKERTATTQLLKKFLCDIDGVEFQDDQTMDRITFQAFQNGAIAFSGELAGIPINGEMIASAYSLVVKSGTVTGSVILKNNCTAISGMLTIKSNGASRNINYKKKDESL